MRYKYSDKSGHDAGEEVTEYKKEKNWLDPSTRGYSPDPSLNHFYMS